MGIKEIKGQLGRIAAVVDGWARGQQISDIEREMVLDQLRRVYEQVMFLDRPGAADETMDEGELSPAEAVAAAVESAAFSGPAVEVGAPAPDETEPQPSSDFSAALVDEASLFDMAEMAQAAASRNPSLDRRVILSLYGEADAPAFDEPGEVVEEIIVVENDVPEVAEVEVVEDAPAEEASEPGTLPEPAEEPVADVASQPEEEPAEESEPASESEAAESIEEPEPEAAPEPAEEPVTTGRPRVLGEVIGNGERLGDTFGKGTHPADVASRVASARTMSLRSAIGINDKFLIIGEVFAGDAAAYEAAIDELDAFDDLDEALIHIHDSYAWDPDAEGVKSLVEILSRKLS